MKNAFKILTTCLLAGLVFMAACKKDDEETAAQTLYDRLGGITAISAVVDQFLANVVADNTINGFFAATVADPFRTQLLRNNLIDQICAGAGGPCQYKGKNMKEAHTGMNTTQAQFDALVADLVAALDKFNVPDTEKNELLGILGPMQADIVGQ